ARSVGGTVRLSISAAASASGRYVRSSGLDGVAAGTLNRRRCAADAGTARSRSDNASPPSHVAAPARRNSRRASVLATSDTTATMAPAASAVTGRAGRRARLGGAAHLRRERYADRRLGGERDVVGEELRHRL